MSVFWYFNTGFDFELTGGLPERYRMICEEMTLYALLAAEKDDCVYSEIKPHHSYLEFLAKHGFCVNIDGNAGKYPQMMGIAWGWNKTAKEIFDRAGATYYYPPVEIVKNANSRTVSNTISRKMSCPSSGKTFFTFDRLTKYLESENRRPLLLKPVFGSSGASFILLRDYSLNDRDRGRLTNIFSAPEQGISVEPLLDRVDDYAMNFVIRKDGSVGSESFHQTIVSSRGGFSGIVQLPQDEFREDYLLQIHSAAEAAAEYLHASGYYGPAGIDSFTYRDDKGVVRFNPMCEINARLTMGEVARGLQKTLGGRYSILRQVRSYHLGSSIDYQTLRNLYGTDWYDPGTQQGIFTATSPRICINGVEALPRTILIYIAASSRNELERLYEITRK
jgi:hypothetical protein